MLLPLRFPLLLNCLSFATALAVCLSAIALAQSRAQSSAEYAGIRVVDAATGRGVPQVELETVNNVRFITDNAGLVAINEPGWLGQETFFFVRTHGYAADKDGFGYAGARVTLQAGEIAEIKLTRVNLAERLCRLTGEGLWRDSILLGEGESLPAAPRGAVAGQDSVQTAMYHDRVYWFWGDTARMKYPLGLFRTAGATSPVPDANDPASDPAGGIPFEYFVGEDGFARVMMPLSERREGVVWIFGVCTVKDVAGREHLLGHYSRRKSLSEEIEQGIAEFNDERQIFEPVRVLPAEETWRRLAGNPITYSEGGREWLLCGSPVLNVRVPATYEAVLDPTQYQALTCAQATEAGKPPAPQFTPDGPPDWRWQTDLPPTDAATELRWLKNGRLQPDQARFLLTSANDASERVLVHSGSVRWNEHRQRWIMIAGQVGGQASNLGEVWYAESRAPSGPFGPAVRIVTHDRQSFYNVNHHAFLDREGGRLIHFEGTYTNTFSGNAEKTPRYDYNQVLYRLDLDNPALRAAQVD